MVENSTWRTYVNVVRSDYEPEGRVFESLRAHHRTALSPQTILSEADLVATPFGGARISSILAATCFCTSGNTCAEVGSVKKPGSAQAIP